MAGLVPTSRTAPSRPPRKLGMASTTSSRRLLATPAVAPEAAQRTGPEGHGAGGVGDDLELPGPEEGWKRQQRAPAGHGIHRAGGDRGTEQQQGIVPRHVFILKRGRATIDVAWLPEPCARASPSGGDPGRARLRLAVQRKCAPKATDRELPVQPCYSDTRACEAVVWPVGTAIIYADGRWTPGPPC